MALSHSEALEAVLFASGEPVAKKKLASFLHTTEGAVASAAEELREKLVGRGLTLVETDGEFELRTSPEAADIVKKLREGELSKDLGRAGLEALAVVMYRGGATRTEIDWIRGVNSSQILRSLLLRGLVERTEDPHDKRKFQYRATSDALAHVGVSKKQDLPRYAELSKEADIAIKEGEHADV
jgi:segregation and condensation protein B